MIVRTCGRCVARGLFVSIIACWGATQAAAPAAPEAEGAWRQRFGELYRLKEDEVAKFIPAPFPPERAAYYRNEAMRGSNPALADAGQFVLSWTGEGRLKFHSFSAGAGTVASAFGACGLKAWELEFGPGVAETRFLPLDGDWIVRDDAPVDRKLAAVQDIVRRRVRRPVDLHRRVLQREVIVVRGRLNFRPLPGAEAGDGILVTADRRIGESGGGSGTLARFLDSLGEISRQPVIDETESGAQRVRWTWDQSASGSSRRPAPLDEVLKNVAQQTGLLIQTEKRTVAIYVLVEGEASAR